MDSIQQPRQLQIIQTPVPPPPPTPILRSLGKIKSKYLILWIFGYAFFTDKLQEYAHRVNPIWRESILQQLSYVQDYSKFSDKIKVKGDDLKSLDFMEIYRNKRHVVNFDDLEAFLTETGTLIPRGINLYQLNLKHVYHDQVFMEELIRQFSKVYFKFYDYNRLYDLCLALDLDSPQSRICKLEVYARYWRVDDAKYDQKMNRKRRPYYKIKIKGRESIQRFKNAVLSKNLKSSIEINEKTMIIQLGQKCPFDKIFIQSVIDCCGVQNMSLIRKYSHLHYASLEEIKQYQGPFEKASIQFKTFEGRYKLEEAWKLANSATRKKAKIEIEINEAIEYMQTNQFQFANIVFNFERHIRETMTILSQPGIHELEFNIINPTLILKGLLQLLCKCPMAQKITLTQLQDYGNSFIEDKEGENANRLIIPSGLSYKSRLHTISVKSISCPNLNLITFILQSSKPTLQVLTLTKIDLSDYNRKDLESFCETLASLSSALHTFKTDLFTFSVIKNSFHSMLSLKNFAIERDKQCEQDSKVEQICKEHIELALQKNQIKFQHLIIHEKSILLLNSLISNRHPTLMSLEVNIYFWCHLDKYKLVEIAQKQSEGFKVRVNDYSEGRQRSATDRRRDSTQLHQKCIQKFADACPGKSIEFQVFND
ncbi:hypothetical protein FGO68_gene8403 [Halteria grandinella]|uniref:Uncharacterized protein n=1 Tax=Halteria grandinella TaxID=5974 RepID=A0A8J8NU24_HALGN|nr:hypothetical protein FGO68_gene8403 [Halteria grandinella]